MSLDLKIIDAIVAFDKAMREANIVMRISLLECDEATEQKLKNDIAAVGVPHNAGQLVPNMIMGIRINTKPNGYRFSPEDIAKAKAQANYYANQYNQRPWSKP